MTPSDTVKTEDSEPVVIAKINYPEFDPDDVETWFICLEAAFSVNMIKQDKQKFYAVIVALGPRAKFFHSAIAQCNESANNDRYETIKAAAIAHFRPSETQRLTSLLSGMTLGDQKPSVLLSEMKRLGGDGCSDTVLLNLWLRALPNTVRSIIASMPTATLDEQAKVADKIMEAPRNEISAFKSPEKSSISCLEQQHRRGSKECSNHRRGSAWFHPGSGDMDVLYDWVHSRKRELALHKTEVIMVNNRKSEQHTTICVGE